MRIQTVAHPREALRLDTGRKTCTGGRRWGGVGACTGEMDWQMHWRQESTGGCTGGGFHTLGPVDQ